MQFEVQNFTIKTRNLPHWELLGSVYFITFNTWEKLELNHSARKLVLDSCLFFDKSQIQNKARYHTFAFEVARQNWTVV